MTPIKQGPPSPLLTEEITPEPEAKKAKTESPQVTVTESVETMLQVKNGISQALPLLEHLPKPKVDPRELVKCLVHNPKILEAFECFITLNTAEAKKHMMALQMENQTLSKDSESILFDLLSECKKRLKSNNEEWQLQIAMNESLIESQLSPPAIALLDFLGDIATLLVLTDAIQDPYIEQEQALETLRLVVSNSSCLIRMR